VKCAPADVSSRLDDAGGARSAFDGLAVESFPSNGAEPAGIRLVLCEEQFLAREGIIRVLDSMEGIELVASCDDLDALRAAVLRTDPDIVVTDAEITPGALHDGIRFAAELHATRPEIGVLVLGEDPAAFDRSTLAEAGTTRRAYLLKERLRDPPALERAIRDVADGGAVMDPRIVESLLTAETSPSRRQVARLTAREREIIELIAAAHTNAAIAERLGITTRGVERHVNAIFAKLGPSDPERVNRRVHAALTYLAAEGRLPDRARSLAPARS
jgi:DNA-binding NarL/FixJ family response regulator